MKKDYLCIAHWVDKETGVTKSRIAPLNKGTNKTGKPYAMTDTDKAEIHDASYNIGQVLTFSMSLE